MNDESLGYREPRGEDQSFPPTDRKGRGFAQAIKTLFREVMEALTHRNKVPPPEPTRRKREDETRGGFRLFAGNITRKIVRSFLDPSNFPFSPPSDPDNAQRLFLLHVFNPHHGGSNAPDVHNGSHDHLSPRL